MTAVRTLAFAVLCCLALAACDHEPTFDASSLPAYQKSLSDINARLSAQDRHKLQMALLTLAAGGSADYTAVALANPSSIVNIEALDGVANLFANLLQPGAQQQVTVNLGTPVGWTAKQLETVYDADLKLKVSNIDDASGRRLLVVNSDVLDTLRRQRDVLRG